MLLQNCAKKLENCLNIFENIVYNRLEISVQSFEKVYVRERFICQEKFTHIQYNNRCLFHLIFLSTSNVNLIVCSSNSN